MLRARGLGRQSERASRRTIARREAVLCAVVRLRLAGLRITCKDLALELGMASATGAGRIRHALRQLIHAGRLPAGTAGVEPERY